MNTQEWREEFQEMFVEHTLDCAMDNSSGRVLKHKGCFLKDSDWNEVESFIERGRLQGIEEAMNHILKISVMTPRTGVPVIKIERKDVTDTLDKLKGEI